MDSLDFRVSGELREILKEANQVAKDNGDKEISIDKIMAKEKRKHVMTLDLNRMEVMAPVRSHELDSYRARNLKEYDFTSREEDAKVYSVVCGSDREGVVIVNLEPNGEMLSAIKSVFPRKVMDI